MAENWFLKKLGAASVAQPAPGLYQPPMNGTGLPVHSTYVPQPPQAQVPNGGFTSYDANGNQVADDGFMHAIHDAAASTGGSAAVKAGVVTCPNCQQRTLFPNDRAENGMPLRTPAAPTCMTCGWPNLQAGSKHGPLDLAKPKGQARAARQVSSNHVVTVMDGGVPISFPPNRGN